MRINKQSVWRSSCLAALLVTGAAQAVEKSESLPVAGDQALAALHPATDRIDPAAKIDYAKLRLLSGQSRGPAMEVFPKVAPSTVLIRTSWGHGTGFVIDDAGWILTNEHVIHGANIDMNTGARYALIHFGDLDDGVMVLEQQSLPALVYAANPDKDLALLKLQKLPEGRKLKPIAFAQKNALPGTDCITIGHPSRGLFWSVRSGEIVGVGKYPHDMIDTIMQSFRLAADDQQKYADSLRKANSRKILTSTCGINPGDSGGPLVNTAGELIAINFAVPKIDQARQVNLDKFSYHVHLDEVKEFAANKPETSEVHHPDYWPPATKSQLQDRDGDKKFESWAFLIDDHQPPSGYLMDLDGDTPEVFLEEFKANRTDRDKFNFEFAYMRIPNHRAFYDRDNDGEIDLILTDIDGSGNSSLSIGRDGDTWVKLDLKEQKLFDPKLFADESLQKRFETVVLLKKDEPQAAPPADAPAENTPPSDAPSDDDLKVGDPSPK